MAYGLMVTDAPRLVLATARRQKDPRRHERRLLAAIVEQAIADARETGATGLSGAAIDAMRWLKSASEEPFSFRWICRMLNVDADAAQQQLPLGMVQ